MSQNVSPARFVATTRRAFVAGSAAAVAAAALPGCNGAGNASQAVGEDEVVFRFAQENPGEALDPQRATNYNALNIADAVCESLLRWNDSYELEPLLASEVPMWSDDGLSLTVKLKEGVTFHDGSAFTSADVKYTFERMFKLGTGAVNTHLYDMIEGADRMIAGETSDLSGVECPDDATVVFHLTTRYAQFRSNLGLSYADIFPHSACEEAGTDWGTGGALVGTGPYTLSADNGSSVTLRANESYHGGAPALDAITVSYTDSPSAKMQSFANGEIDACDLDESLLAQYEQDEAVSPLIHRFDVPGTYFIVLNVQSEPFSNASVRQALSLAIDRQKLVDDVFSGAARPCACFLAPAVPGSLGAEAEMLAYSPDQARTLISEAAPDGLSFTVYVRGTTALDVMEAVAAMWAEVGVTAEVRQLDSTAFANDRADGKLACYLQDWFALYPDGDNAMGAFFRSDKASERSSNYSNATFDQLMDQARSEEDASARGELYRQADDLLVNQDVACLPLVWPQRQFVAQEGVEMTASTLEYRFNDVSKA